MSFRPLGDIVVIRRVENQKISMGGIILPGQGEELNEGIIIAAGSGKLHEDGTTDPMHVKVGDRVLFSKYANLAIKLEGEDLLCMHEADIVGVLDE